MLTNILLTFSKLGIGFMKMFKNLYPTEIDINFFLKVVFLLFEKSLLCDRFS